MFSRLTHSFHFQKWTIVTLSILLISIVSSIPFIFYNKIYFQHDYVFHISRLEAYFESVKDLNFFPKIFYQLGHGGGYATDMFYPSILLLPYVIFRLIGLNMISSLTIFYFLLNMLIAVTSFSLGFYLFKNIKSSILLSVIYTLSTYRFHDVVIRGAIGEIFGFIFIPLALIGLHNILYGNKILWYWLTISMSFLLISHLLSAYMLFLFIVFFSLVKFFSTTDWKDSFKRFLVLCISGICSFLLSLWHLLPILEQTSHSVFNYSQTQLFLPPNNMKQIIKESILSNIYGYPRSTNNIGTFLMISVVVLWICFIKLDIFSKLCLAFTTFLIYMTSSSFPWKLLEHSILKTIQFPFRINLFSTLFISILLVHVIKLKIKNKNFILIFVILTCCILSLRLNFSFKPEFKYQDNISQYYNDPTSFGGGQEYIKIGYNFVTITPRDGKDIEITDSENLSHLNVTRNKNQLIITGSAEKKTVIKTPFLYYYGYSASDQNGNQITCFEKDGRVAIKFPKGANTVSISYKKTIVQIVSAVISFISLILFIKFIFHTRLKKIDA